MNKIVVIGSSNIDMVAKSHYLPKPGETVGNALFLQAYGGKGANQAVAAARLGGEVTFVTSLGNDSFAREISAHFENEGICLDYLHISDKPTGIALILVAENAENCISVAPGANGDLTVANIPALDEILTGADMVVMQAEIPYETIKAVALAAYNKGVKVMFNPAPACAIDAELMKAIDILVVNETEAEVVSGLKLDNIEALAQKLLAQGARSVVITLGKAGVYATDGKSTFDVDAFVVEATDTTAAGDTFCGALAVKCAQGPISEDVLRFACASSAISVTRIGAQTSIPELNEVEQFLRDRK